MIEIVEFLTRVDYDALTVYQQEMILMQVIMFILINAILAFK